MDRMTIKSNIIDGFTLKCLCSFRDDGSIEDEDHCRDYCQYGCCEDCDVCGIQKAFDLLAAYEDTGLTPEEIKNMLHNKSQSSKET